MTGLLLLAAVSVGALLGGLLRRRAGRTETLGSFRKEDRTESGAHAGFPNMLGD